MMYIKLLDFVDFAVQSANSGIGPFASRVLNLTQSIHKKSENLQWEKCRYITDKEKHFLTLHNIFTQNTSKVDLRVMKNTFFNEMVVWGQKKKSKIDCELLLHATFTKLCGSL